MSMKPFVRVNNTEKGSFMQKGKTVNQPIYSQGSPRFFLQPSPNLISFQPLASPLLSSHFSDNQNMDFNKPNIGHPPKHHIQPSNSELLSSAKIVAEAAQFTLRNETDKIDKAKSAGAAEDLLNAASKYGKLDEKAFGGYVDKAEDYLHQYHSSHSTTTTTTNPDHSATTTTTTITHSSSHSGGEDNSGTGYGDYMKMAEGFFKKR